MDVFKTLLKRMDAGQRCVLATVVEKTGDGPVVLGGKLLLSDNGDRIGSIGGGALEETIIAACQDILRSGQSTMIAYDLSDCGGSAKIFYEYMAPQANLFVFGAGNVGREIIKKSEGLGFESRAHTLLYDYIDYFRFLHDFFKRTGINFFIFFWGLEE